MRPLRVLEISFAAGLALAVVLPPTLTGKFYAVLAVPPVALLAVAVAHFRKKSREKTADPDFSSLATAPAQATPPDTTQWSLELLKRLEWRRFEELCAAYLPTQGAHAALVRCVGGNVHSVGIRAVREL